MNVKLSGFGESRLKSYMQVLVARKDTLTAWSAPELFVGDSEYPVLPFLCRVIGSFVQEKSFNFLQFWRRHCGIVTRTHFNYDYWWSF